MPTTATLEDERLDVTIAKAHEARAALEAAALSGLAQPELTQFRIRSFDADVAVCLAMAFPALAPGVEPDSRFRAAFFDGSRTARKDHAARRPVDLGYVPRADQRTSGWRAGYWYQLARLNMLALPWEAATYQAPQSCHYCLRTVGTRVARPYTTTVPGPGRRFHRCVDLEACTAHRAATEMGASGSAHR